MTNPNDPPPVLPPKVKAIVQEHRDLYDVCLDYGNMLARRHTDNERAFNALAPEVGRDLFASVMRRLTTEG